MGDDNSLKNRVQPANSPQAKCFVSRAMMGSELVAGSCEKMVGQPAAASEDR